MFHANSISCFVALCLLGLAAPGHALTTFCVDSSQQFNQALTAASASSDSLVLIRLRQGSYDAFAATQPFVVTAKHAGQIVDISGGWTGTDATCVSNSVDPAPTQLIGTEDWPTLTLAAVASGSQILLHDLAISNPNHLAATVGGACLYVSTKTGSEARVERVHLHDCVARNTSYAAGFFSNDGGTLTLRDIAVWDSIGMNYGGLAVTSNLGGISRLAHISITRAMGFNGNPDTSAGILLNTADSLSRIALSNSVSWGNSGYVNTHGDTVYVSDVAVYGHNVSLARVHRGSLHGTPDVDIAPGSGDPGFLADGDAHLRADSILLDTGIDAPDGGSGAFDADGHVRLQNGHLDVGAFEGGSDVVFKDGFQ